MEKDDNLKEIIEAIQNELNKSYSIEEALKEKENENKLINDSFESLWESYNAVNTVRVEEIKKMTTFKYKIILRNLLLMMVRDDTYFQIVEFIKLLDEATLELKDEKKLLLLIKEAIQKLQSQKVCNCNYDLSILLSLLFDKNIAIFKDNRNEAHACASRINGISTQSTTKYKDEKEILDKEIDKLVLKLGIK